MADIYRFSKVISREREREREHVQNEQINASQIELTERSELSIRIFGYIKIYNTCVWSVARTHRIIRRDHVWCARVCVHIYLHHSVSVAVAVAVAANKMKTKSVLFVVCCYSPCWYTRNVCSFWDQLCRINTKKEKDLNSCRINNNNSNNNASNFKDEQPSSMTHVRIVLIDKEKYRRRWEKKKEKKNNVVIGPYGALFLYF